MNEAMSLTAALGTSILGFSIVFFVLVVLMIMITVLRSVMEQVSTGAAASAAAPAAAPAPAANMVPAKGSVGDIKLHDVDDKTAAMIMAIVADTMKKPLNELRFLSIREKK